jgi:hypothetical protein
LKDCFLYFAAFPKDSKIYFEDILWGWIGEGLVTGHGGDDSSADAFSLLKKLWKRSFIESDEEDLLTFKVHDVMRDLAFYILENDSSTPLAKQLYLYRAGQNLEEFPQELKAPYLKFNHVSRAEVSTPYLIHVMSLLLANSWTFDLLVLTSHVHECRPQFISYGRLLETCGKQK